VKCGDPDGHAGHISVVLCAAWITFVQRKELGRPCLSRRPYSETLRRVALVRVEVSEDLVAPIIKVARIGELGTTLAVTSNRSTL
jgi:hypothetical protein